AASGSRLSAWRERADELFAPRSGEDRPAENEGLRGVPEDGRHVAASAPVPRLRPRRLLRRLEEQARDQALPLDEAPDHHVARAGRGLELVLRRRSDDGASLAPDMQPLISPTRAAREAQMFPILEPEEVTRVRRFAAQRHYAKGE